MSRLSVRTLSALVVWAAAALSAGPAQAIVIVSETENGNAHTLFNAASGVEDGKFQSQVVFDNLNAVTASYALEGDDLTNANLPAGAIVFSHRFFNVTGIALDGYLIEIFGGLTFDEPAFVARLGLVPPTPTRVQTLTTLEMGFDPSLPSGDLSSNISGAFTGAPTTDAIISQDVRMALNGLGAGDTFSVRYTPLLVPEPGAVVLLGAGLLALVARARRAGGRRPLA